MLMKCDFVLNESSMQSVHNLFFYSVSSTVVTTITKGTVPGERIPGVGENDCKCSEGSSSDFTVIAVSAVSLLLIVTLTTVILTLIIRMRRSSRDQTDTYAEVTNPTTKTTDVPVSPNEAYALHKITTEEVTYEMVK